MPSQKNFSLTNIQLGEMINPKDMSQGVHMTYAASGSSGIQVVDNDNINFGTGDFTNVGGANEKKRIP
jgi:hypothetical protein